MQLNRILLILVIVLIGGCGSDRDSDSHEKLAEATLPGVFSGMFPCDGCPGIASTLWLRADGRFFFEQRYPEQEASKAIDVYSLGRWSLNADDLAIELSGAGPRRTFIRTDPDTLFMQTDSELEHRLTRDPVAMEFSATIRMVGKMSMRGGSAVFTECLAGFVAPVSKGGDFARFRHQYQSTARPGVPTFVELEGHFSWSNDGSMKSLRIDRFITVKANGAC